MIKDKGPCMSYFYFKDYNPKTSRGCNGNCGLSHDVVQLGKIGQEKCIRKNCRFFHQYVRGANQKLNLCAFYHEGDELKVKVAQKWAEVKEDEEILNLHSIEGIDISKEKLKTKQMKETPCMSYFATGNCIIKGCKKSHDPKILAQVGSTVCYRGDLCQKSTRMVTKNISFCSFLHSEADQKKLELAKRWENYDEGFITKDQIFKEEDSVKDVIDNISSEVKKLQIKSNGKESKDFESSKKQSCSNREIRVDPIKELKESKRPSFLDGLIELVEKGY